MRDFLRGWRTIIVNTVTLLFVALEVLVPVLHLPEFLAVLPPEWAPYVVLGLAVVNILLRVDTRTPPGRSE
jgi:hypothetical protein